MSTISPADVLTCATLSRLIVDENQCQAYANALGKILSMMEVLSSVNTDDIKPLTNVHDGVQVLRPDVVDLNGLVVNRELNQAIAPAVQDGLYLVPQVIE